MNNITVGHGTTQRSYFVPNRTEQTINGTLVIDNSVLDKWWVSHIESNQTTAVQVNITAVIELPNGDTLRLPLDPLSQKRTFETDLLSEQNRSVVR